jgi:two-component system, NtrC family, response regulator AtoC
MTNMLPPMSSPTPLPMPGPAPELTEVARGLRILGVGDDSGLFRELGRFLESHGVIFERVPDASTALRALQANRWDIAMVLLEDDPEEQLQWWTDVLRPAPHRPRLVAMVPSPSIGLSLRAAQLGVFEVLPLPPERDQVRELLRRVRSAEDEVPLPLPVVRPVFVGPYPLVSEAPAMLPVFRSIAQVAPSTATVLIMGESGTGKELVARAIHQNGPRKDQPFVAVNCAAIPENLLESELFGHDKGAFTGAVARKIGRFERANNGTLFLDEIGDMSLALQSKMLRAVQERVIERVGGTEEINVDVRLIAATNRDLVPMMTQGKFREDLYYRLAVVTVKLPRLADRGDDLLLLTAAFLKEFGQRYNKSFRAVTDRALELLRRHDWVGNVRELRNVIERAVLVAESDVLRAEHLPEEWRTGVEQAAQEEARPLASLQEMETRHIARVLAHTRGQIGEAARILGVHRNTLARKIKEYGL